MNINGLGYVAAGTSRDVFVVDLALSNYGVKWVKTYGTADDDWANGVAIDPSGNIYVSGYVNGATNNAAGNVAFGAKSLLLKHVDAHSFVLKLDSAGVAQWVVGFDATTANGGYRTDCTTLAISKTGNIGVGCSTGGTLAFATGAASTDTRTYGGGQTNVWLAELEPTNGYVTWGALLNGNNPDGVAQVAYDSQNALYAVGTTSSTTLATVDAPAFTITKAVGGSGAGWIAKLNAGAPRTLGFTQTWGGATTVSAVSVAIDPKDRPYVAGGFSSTINFGGAAAMIAAGTMDSYLLALNPSTGATIAQTQIGASANAFNATAIASDDLGNIAVAGYYAGTGFTLAGTALPASAGPDTSSVIAKYPPALATPIYAQPSIAEPEDSGNGSGLHLLRMVTHAGETFAVGTISGNGDLGDGKRSTHTLGGTTFLIRRAR